MPAGERETGKLNPTPVICTFLSVFLESCQAIVSSSSPIVGRVAAIADHRPAPRLAHVCSHACAWRACGSSGLHVFVRGEGEDLCCNSSCAITFAAPDRPSSRRAIEVFVKSFLPL
jgi:hypothetical protein